MSLVVGHTERLDLAVTLALDGDCHADVAVLGLSNSNGTITPDSAPRRPAHGNFQDHARRGLDRHHGRA